MQKYRSYLVAMLAFHIAGYHWIREKKKGGGGSEYFSFAEESSKLTWSLQQNFTCWSNIVALEFQNMPVILSVVTLKQM